MAHHKLAPHFLKIILPLHVLGVVGVWMVFANSLFQWHHLIATLIGWVLISGYGIAIGYHRFLAHRSFKTYRPIEKAMVFLGCLGAQGSPIFWMSLHMGLHHPQSDTADDLHSPTRGFWSSYMGWQMFLQKTNAPLKTGFHLTADPFYKFLHKNYYKVVWVPVVVLGSISPVWCLFALVLPMIISMHQENLINSICHCRSMGYKNFETSDNSVNNVVLGLLCFGQGWHNNHHARPREYNFGYHWYEVDPAKYLIAPIMRRDTGP